MIVDACFVSSYRTFDIALVSLLLAISSPTMTTTYHPTLYVDLDISKCTPSGYQSFHLAVMTRGSAS